MVGGANPRLPCLKRRGVYGDPRMRLEKLTIKAQEALAAARDLADQRNHQEVTPEHVLQALLAQDQGVATALLRKLGADPEAVASRTEAALDQMPQVRGATADVYVGRRL